MLVSNIVVPVAVFVVVIVEREVLGCYTNCEFTLDPALDIVKSWVNCSFKVSHALV